MSEKEGFKNSKKAESLNIYSLKKKYTLIQQQWKIELVSFGDLEEKGRVSICYNLLISTFKVSAANKLNAPRSSR